MPKGVYARTELMRKNIGEATKRRTNGMLGKKHTEETKKILRKKRIEYFSHIENREKRKGKNHPLWKGDKVGYFAFHHWIQRILGKPSKCIQCGKEGLQEHKIHWANKSGKYLRDLSDWIRLCVSCHKRYDLCRKQN